MDAALALVDPEVSDDSLWRRPGVQGLEGQALVVPAEEDDRGPAGEQFHRLDVLGQVEGRGAELGVEDLPMEVRLPLAAYVVDHDGGVVLQPQRQAGAQQRQAHEVCKDRQTEREERRGEGDAEMDIIGPRISSSLILRPTILTNLNYSTKVQDGRIRTLL